MTRCVSILAHEFCIVLSLRQFVRLSVLHAFTHEVSETSLWLCSQRVGTIRYIGLVVFTYMRFCAFPDISSGIRARVSVNIRVNQGCSSV